MKRSTILACMMSLILAPALYSCLDDDSERITPVTLGTVRVVEGQDYYFGLDNGEKMYPGDTTEIHQYDLVEGQRAFVWYNILDHPKTGYDYNVKIEGIINVLTKGIIPLTEETADSIGDNRIGIYTNQFWVAQGYLTIRFAFYGSYSPEKPHMLNLVQNETVEPKDDEYIHLEFRHNAYGDHPDYLLEGYVSFKLDKIAEQMKTAKGLKIRVKTLNHGVQELSPRILDKGVDSQNAIRMSAFQGAAHNTGTIY